MAYLEFSKADGRTYVYISKYVGKQEFTSKVEERILALGRADNALIKLIDWRNNEDLMPIVIEENLQDKLNEWIPRVAMRLSNYS